MANTSITRTERAQVNGVELEFQVWGAGEPVLLIHGSILADAYAPLLAEPRLTEQYRLISYHRRGFAGSTHPDGPVGIAQQAADGRALMQRLGVDRAHVVGHSYGGVIALQLALDMPAAVHSLALLEPALMMVPSAQQFFEAMAPVIQRYQAGDKAGAIDAFLRVVAGPDYRAVFDQVLPPGAFEQAVADAATFFQVELPALQEWTFTPELAQRITVPVLTVLGEHSGEVASVFPEGQDLLRAWLPQTESFVLPGATHALQMQNPRGMADGLADFFARHPLAIGA
jgi:pimeloyl-ACP methyl ester carboxylesterase